MIKEIVHLLLTSSCTIINNLSTLAFIFSIIVFSHTNDYQALPSLESIHD